MNKNKDTLQLISNENLAIYGITKNNFHFKGYDYWYLLDIVRQGIIKNENLLTEKQEFEYLKCYVNAVVTVIARKYKSLSDKTFEGRFQIDYLHELVPIVRNYYDAKPYLRFFKSKPFPPANEKEDKSIRNWITKKASFELSTMHTNWVKYSFERDGIDYEAYRQACIDFDRAKAMGKFPEEVNIDNFRRNYYYKECVEDAHAIIENTEDVKNVNIGILDEIEGLVLNDEIINELSEDEIEPLLIHFKMNDEKRMKLFFELVAGNRITNINSSDMWKVQHYRLDMGKVWLIYYSLSLGASITANGKQFLLMQFFMIAIAVLKDLDYFEIKNEEVYLNSKQATLLCSVITKTYLHFYNGYKKLILKEVNKKPEDDDIKLKEKLLQPFLSFIRTKLNAKIKKSKKDREKKNNLKLSSISEIDLKNLFENTKEFNSFIMKLKTVMSPELSKMMNNTESEEVESHLSKELKSFLSDEDFQITTIYNYLNPQSQKENDDINFKYLVSGCISASIIEMISETEEDVFEIVLSNESNFDIDVLAGSTAEILKMIIAENFDISRNELPEGVNNIINNYKHMIEYPIQISIPDGNDYDSFRSLIEINGDLRVNLPKPKLTGEPFHTQKLLRRDKLSQLFEKSLLQELQAIDIKKEILKYL